MGQWITVIRGPIEIRIWFRNGLRLPLRENDVVELWLSTLLLGSLSGETVRHLIQHHMADYELQRVVAQDLGRLDKALSVARKPPRPVLTRPRLRRKTTDVLRVRRTRNA